MQSTKQTDPKNEWSCLYTAMIYANQISLYWLQAEDISITAPAFKGSRRLLPHRLGLKPLEHSDEHSSDPTSSLGDPTLPSRHEAQLQHDADTIY
jgi:hypothetical protein